MDNLNKLGEVINDGSSCIFSIDRVVKRQVNKTLKAKEYICSDEPEKVLAVIEAALLSLKALKCGICGLNGHSNAYCWLNG